MEELRDDEKQHDLGLMDRTMDQVMSTSVPLSKFFFGFIHLLADRLLTIACSCVYLVIVLVCLDVNG